MSFGFVARRRGSNFGAEFFQIPKVIKRFRVREGLDVRNLPPMNDVADGDLGDFARFGARDVRHSQDQGR